MVKVVAAAAALVAVGAGGALGARELGLRDNSESESFAVVDGDRSWLEYLPNDVSGEKSGLQVTDLQPGEGTGTRRIDIAEPGARGGVSLCFARSEALLAESCAGAKALGRMTARSVDAPWVGQIGASDIDYRALLETEAPTVDEARSIVG
jgi:hypothetical protein